MEAEDQEMISTKNCRCWKSAKLPCCQPSPPPIFQGHLYFVMVHYCSDVRASRDEESWVHDVCTVSVSFAMAFVMTLLGSGTPYSNRTLSLYNV